MNLSQRPQKSTSDVGDHALFAGHPDVWKALAPHMHSKTYHKDDMVIPHGDPAKALWVVLSGWVKLTRQTPDGKESVVGLCTEGDVFGEAALFAHANYPYNAEVLATNTELGCIPAETIRGLIAQDAHLSSTIMAMLGERVQQTQLKLEHMSTLSAAQRLGCFLLRLCRLQASGKKQLKIPIEKHVLATYLGMKPETLSRSQQQLKPLGINVTGHDISVADIHKLREFVCSSCSESGTCETELAD